MARGWESKSVESQIEDRRAENEQRRTKGGNPAALEHSRKLDTLELSRRRVMKELESARSKVHRTALEHALKHLDDEISRLR